MDYASLVRNQIESTFSSPDSHNMLISRISSLRRSGIDIPEELDLEICADCETFVRTMVGLVVDLEIATQHVHISTLARPILKQLYEYFLDPNDALPDHTGTLGLLDDAYLAYRFLTRLDDIYQLETGASLFTDLPHATAQLVRSLITPHLADVLESAVDQTIAQQCQVSQFPRSMTPELTERWRRVKADQGNIDLGRGLGILSGNF